MKTTYRIRPLPLQHELDVEILFEGVDGPDLALKLPTWVPGAYGFMKYGRDLFDVTASDAASGRPLAVRREGWSGFRVAEAKGTVRVSYRVYSIDHAWGELVGYIGHENAVLLGTHYLYAPAHAGPVTARYELPAGWKLHHPAGATQLSDSTFEYPRYAVLLDTPVVMGRFEVHTRASDGVPFHHVFLDRTVGFEREVEPFIDSLMKVAEQCRALFGKFPFESYTYVFSFSPLAHWGLEHASSTMIGLGENALIDPKARARGVRVCAHELYHAWNVCRLKPAPLGNPDHAGGSFPDGLWISEGFTRYYEFLLGVRAGEFSAETLVANLVNYYRHLTVQPAYARVTAADSSMATFLNHNKYPGSVNDTIDYYDKGMLIAFDLDAHLRLQANPSSLDTVFRDFYDAFHGKGDGFTHAQVKEFFGTRSPGLVDLIAREVEQPAGLTTLGWLEKLGFEVEHRKVPYLGLVLADENKGPAIANLLDTSPAGQSGLAPGDKIVKQQGYPFSLAALKWLVAHEERVQLEVLRGHETFDFEIPVAQRRDVHAVTWNGDDTQLAQVRAWVHQPSLALTRGQAVSLESYENFHGIQTVL